MKQKDWGLVIAVTIVAGIVALLLSNAVIAPPKNRKQQVEVVDVITDTFSEPNKDYFNDQSIDPTKLIQIGDNANPTPF